MFELYEEGLVDGRIALALVRQCELRGVRPAELEVDIEPYYARVYARWEGEEAQEARELWERAKVELTSLEDGLWIAEAEMCRVVWDDMPESFRRYYLDRIGLTDLPSDVDFDDADAAAADVGACLAADLLDRR